MNNTGARPIGDRVLLRRIEPERMISGIHLPDGSERWPPIGEVLAVGCKVKDVAVGMRVYFKSRASSALIPDSRESGKLEWKLVVMLREEDILAVID